jgi:membrane associated rhomboid family serine protease
MIPLKDNIPSSTRPYINYGIIIINFLVFFWELDWGRQLPQLVISLGFVPARFITLLGAESYNWPAIVIPPFSAFFLHSGWLHIIANMWFLYIFGDNVEDALGHVRYLLLYLVCGAGSNLLYLMFAPHSTIPLIGASGAIAGVMGAYFTLFPGARILTLFLIIFIPIFLELPAYFFLGLWLVLQFLYGSFTSMQLTAQRGGVAWWAHVGGFLLGFLLLRLLVPHRMNRIFRRF